MGEELLIAATSGDVNKVREYLEEKNVNADWQDEFGSTALNKACFRGHSEVVHLLLQNGATVDLQDNYGWAPIHWACDHNYSALILTLLEKGSKINIQDQNGSTPLHWACHYGHASLVKLLLEKGADPFILDKLGRTPLDSAKRSDKPDCGAVLEMYQRFHQDRKNWLSFNRFHRQQLEMSSSIIPAHSVSLLRVAIVPDLVRYVTEFM